MKSLLVTCLVGFIASYLGLWWGIWLGGFAAGLAYSESTWWKETLMSALGGLLLWGGWSFLLYRQGGQIITERMSELLEIGQPSTLLVISAILGALLATLGWTAGRVLKW